MHHGMFIPLMRSFINFSADRCYKIYNLLWSDAKSSFWDLLHSGYADSLGWYKQEAEDFESAEVAEFAASVGLYTHKQYVKRMSVGRRINVKRLSLAELRRRLNNVHVREKFNAFFERRKNKKKKNSTPTEVEK